MTGLLPFRHGRVLLLTVVWLGVLLGAAAAGVSASDDQTDPAGNVGIATDAGDSFSEVERIGANHDDVIGHTGIQGQANIFNNQQLRIRNTHTSESVVLDTEADIVQRELLRDSVAVQNDEPIAECAVEPTDVEPDEEVTIDADDSENVDRVDFDTNGDGTFDETVDEEPFVVTTSYEDEGEYTPRIRAISNDPRGADETDCPTVTVSEPDPPAAEFDWSPSEPVTGEEVTFDASDSVSPDGEIVEYRWDFDWDGEEIPDWDETTSSEITTHTYEESGDKTVILEVEDDNGETDTAGAEIFVDEPEPIEAEFDWDPEEPRVTEETVFDASESESPDSEIVEYRWEFDWEGEDFFDWDEETSEPTTAHTYEETGEKTVVLEVEDGLGQTDRQSEDLTVQEGEPVAHCAVEPTTVDTGEEVTIDADDSENVDRVDFDTNGDGTFDETVDEEPFVVTTSYEDEGEYTPRIRAISNDPRGADETDCPTVTVSEPDPPTAEFDWSPDEPETGEEVLFDAGTSFAPDGEIIEYRWDLDGDGTFDAIVDEETLAHTYDTSGTRTVTLEVEDDNGQIDETSNGVFVQPPEPVAECTVEPTVVEPGEEVVIDADDSENAVVVEFDTNGDGQFDELVDEEPFVVTTTYEQEGEVTPVVRVWGEREQSDVTECQTVVVEEDPDPPTAEFEWSPVTTEVDQPATFDASDSVAPDGTIETHRWDFTGDGEFDEITDDPLTDHTFEEAGTQVVTLEVEDSNGLTDTTGSELSVEEPPPEPVPQCTVSETEVEPGETVTIDASDSENALAVEFDTNGDGEFDETRSGEEAFTVEVSYEEEGEVTPRIRVIGEREQSEETDCPTIVVEEDPDPPTAEFEWSPDPPEVDQPATFDASDSVAPDGTIETYRWDFTGDGEFGEITDDPLTDHTFEEAGTQVVTLEVEDSNGLTDTTGAELIVEEPPPEPVPQCTISETEVEPGETVTIDASDSENALAVEFDTNGDGEFDETRSGEEAFTVEVSYEEEGEVTPRIRVIGERERTMELACELIVVEEEDEDDNGFPFDQDLLFALGALVLGGGGVGYGAYRFFPSGGGGSSTTTTPTQYDTGVIRIDPGSSEVSVTGVGFEPDLLLVSATTALPQEDDRTMGWSWGRAVGTDEGIEQYATAVADDTESTDRGTCEASRGQLFDLISHGDRTIDRVSGEVVAFTSEGVDIDIERVGDADGAVELLYQAFASGADLSIDTGRTAAGDEPGPTAVDLDVDASMVRVETTTGVEEDGKTVTTDQAVGLSAGVAIADESATQAGFGAVTSPRRARQATSACGPYALSVQYLDGERIAGTTRGSVTNVGETLGLYFERAYNGPHRVDPTGSHPIDYLAIDAGVLTPTVGRIEVPAVGEQAHVELDFEPGLIEVVAVRSADDDPAAPSGVPLGWSHGTAIRREGRIDQYVLDGTRTSPESSGEEVTEAAGDVGGVDQQMPDPGSIGQPGQAISDGGLPDDVRNRYGRGVVDPADLGEPTPSRMDRVSDAVFGDDTPDGDEGEGVANAPVDTPGEERLSRTGALQTPSLDAGDTAAESGGEPRGDNLPPGSDHVAVAVGTSGAGEIVDRREVAVTAMAEYGFTLEAEGFRTDEPTGGQSYLWYVAWPALDYLETEEREEQ